MCLRGVLVCVCLLFTPVQWLRQERACKFKLAAGNTLERLWALTLRAGLKFSMMLASAEVVKTPPKSACYPAGTVHCPSADTDLCIALNSSSRLFCSYNRLGTNSYVCSWFTNKDERFWWLTSWSWINITMLLKAHWVCEQDCSPCSKYNNPASVCLLLPRVLQSWAGLGWVCKGRQEEWSKVQKARFAREGGDGGWGEDSISSQNTVSCCEGKTQ